MQPEQVFSPVPRATPLPPSRPGDVPQQSLPWVLAQASPCTASRSGPLTKEPSPLRAARAFILWNFLRKTFFRMVLALGRRRLGHADLARVRGTRAGDDPGICVQPHDTAPSAYHSCEGTRRLTWTLGAS